MATAVLSPSPSSILSPIDSGARYDASAHQKHEQVDVGSMALPDIFLVKKIVAVLNNMGYSESSQQKVAGLVVANIVDAVVTPEATDDSVGAALSQILLDEKTLQRKNLRLNSNEPILLVEGSEATAENGELESVKQELLATLRTKGVKPVRVYTRTVESQADESEIKALVLNVVNTELGGPSMVQLLDAAFYGVEWKQELMSKEAWNGYDLMWRDQVSQQTQPLVQHEVVEEPASKMESEKEDEVEPEAEPVPQVDETTKSVDTNTVERPQVQRVDTYPKSDDEEPEISPVEHPDMKALRERELQRIAVQHPTWAREHEGQSLLDIITTQSAGMTTTDPISLIANSTISDDKDDFEILEKP